MKASEVQRLPVAGSIFRYRCHRAEQPLRLAPAQERCLAELLSCRRRPGSLRPSELGLIWYSCQPGFWFAVSLDHQTLLGVGDQAPLFKREHCVGDLTDDPGVMFDERDDPGVLDRKSTRLNSS